MITLFAQRIALAASAVVLMAIGTSVVGAETPAPTAPVAATAEPGTVAGPDASPTTPAATSGPFAPEFAYRSAAFTDFVADSYRQPGAAEAGSGPEAFYRGIDRAYLHTWKRVGLPPGLSAPPPSLESALAAESHVIAANAEPEQRTAAEEKAARWAYGIVKRAIPHFSLNNGYEFYNMVARGQRQCFAQSVLAASMLQAMGMPAGVAMVWKSPQGVVSNNGHAVTIARLSNGRHLLVDCSAHQPFPFPRQQGLFLRLNGQYADVTPEYVGGVAPGSTEVAAYVRAGGGEQTIASAAQAMDLPFMKSQFDYYRGERAPGGVFAAHRTVPGLETSVRYLSASAAECPENPLAVYMLGRADQYLGRRDSARMQFAEAYRAYSRSGYVPEGEADECSRSGAYADIAAARPVL